MTQVTASDTTFDSFKISGYVPEDLFVRRNVGIGIVEESIDSIAQAVMIRLESLGYNGRVTDLSLATAMKTAFKLRIRQVCKMKPIPGYRITDFKIWSVLFPILAQIGIYRDEANGLELYPIVEDMDVTVDDIVHMNETVSGLAYWGLSYSMGLPKDVEITDSAFYELCLNANNVLGNKNVPSPTAVMSRLFFQVASLGDVYGGSRVVYSTIRYLQQVFVDVVSEQLKNPSSIKT